MSIFLINYKLYAVRTCMNECVFFAVALYLMYKYTKFGSARIIIYYINFQEMFKIVINDN